MVQCTFTLGVVGACLAAALCLGFARVSLQVALHASWYAIRALRKFYNASLTLTRHDEFILSKLPALARRVMGPAILLVFILENSSQLVAAMETSLTQPMEMSPMQFLLCFGAFALAFHLMAKFKAQWRESAAATAAVSVGKTWKQDDKSLAYALETSSSLRNNSHPYHTSCATTTAAAMDPGVNVYYKENYRNSSNMQAMTPRSAGLQASRFRQQQQLRNTGSKAPPFTFVKS